MYEKAFQDYYPDNYSHCYGCGRLNQDGMQLKSYWDNEETVCHYTPKSYHSGGLPGNIYGGLIASLIDCHSAASAMAAKMREENHTSDDRRPVPRFVTASLKVDYLKPTPMGTVLEIRGRIKEIKPRKVIVSTTLFAEGEIRAKGEVVMVQLTESSGE
jgi:acyl-coenzyme A thioesterase PaaI-like protein